LHRSKPWRKRKDNFIKPEALGADLAGFPFSQSCFREALMRYRSAIFFPKLISVGAFLLLCAAGLDRSGAAAQGYQRLFRHGTPSNCQLQPGGESTVLAVAGPQTLRLADGRFVRLSEILVPAAASAGFDPSQAAAAYLRQAASGRKVEVKFGGTARDRYGVYAGHIYVTGEPGVWLQEGLVSAGLATVYPQTDNHACARELLAFEADAREKKRGHWGLAYFKILQARDPRSILNLVQTYQIVEGTVTSAAESGGRLTLQFERQNKYGFAAILETAARKRFADKQTPESWAGLRLRVRGWVEKRRGPSISAAQPEQIEFTTSTAGTDTPEREPQ
jgi:endonuclease YncB( thermonuclease family)